MRSLEISNFLHFCPLVRPYSFYMCPFQRTFVSISYPLLSQKKFRVRERKETEAVIQIYIHKKKQNKTKKKSPGLFNQKKLLFGGLGQLLATAKQLSEEETLLAV